MSVQSLEQRRAELLRLQAATERELLRVEAAIADQPKRRRSRYEVPPCGTEQGYQRHYSHGESIDDDCAEAHRLHNRRQERRTA